MNYSGNLNVSSFVFRFDDVAKLIPKAYNFIQKDLFKSYQSSRSLTTLEAYISLKYLRWRLVDNNSIASICWDNKLKTSLIEYNYKFNEKLPTQTVGFIILHEYLHIYLKHPNRFKHYLKKVPYELINVLVDVEVNLMLGLTGKSLVIPKDRPIRFLEDFLPLSGAFFPSIQMLEAITSKEYITIQDITIFESLIETYNSQRHVEISVFLHRIGMNNLLSRFPKAKHLELSKDKFLVSCVVSDEKFYEKNKDMYPNSIWLLIDSIEDLNKDLCHKASDGSNDRSGSMRGGMDDKDKAKDVGNTGEGEVMGGGGKAKDAGNTREGEVMDGEGKAKDAGNTRGGKVMGGGGKAKDAGNTGEGEVMGDGGKAKDAGNTGEGEAMGDGGEAKDVGNTGERKVTEGGGKAKDAGNTGERKVTEGGGKAKDESNIVIRFHPERKERMVRNLEELAEKYDKIKRELEGVFNKIIKKVYNQNKNLDSGEKTSDIPGSSIAGSDVEVSLGLGIGCGSSETSSVEIDRTEYSRTLYEYMRSIDYEIHRYFESLHRRGITFWEFRGKYSYENSNILDDFKYTPIPTEADFIVNDFGFKVSKGDTKIYGIANIVIDVSGSMSNYVEPCVFMILPPEGERFRNIYYVTQIDTEVISFIRLSDHSDKQNFIASHGGGTDLYPAVKYLYSEFSSMPKTDKTNINKAYEYYSELREEIRKMIPLVLITDGLTPPIDLRHIQKDTPVFVIVIDDKPDYFPSEMMRFDSLSEMEEKVRINFLIDFGQRPGGIYLLWIDGDDLINAYNDVIKMNKIKP